MVTAVITTDRIALPVIGTFLVLYAVGGIVFYRGKDAEFKRWLWPRYVIGAAALLGVTATVSVLVSGSMVALCFLLIGTPAYISTCAVNASMGQFCDRCGALVFPNAFAPPRLCSRCGAELEAKKPADHRSLE